MSALEEALTLRADEDGWTAFADPRYESMTAMFGGWTTAVALRATLASAADDATPSAITVSFVDRVEPGSRVHARSRCMGRTRSVQHWLTELASPDDRTLAVATVVLTNRRETHGYTQFSRSGSRRSSTRPRVPTPGPDP